MTNPKLEHVNLVVAAIEPTVAFLTAAFPGWRIRGGGAQPFAGMARQWVHVGDDDFYLALTAYELSPEYPEEKDRQRDLKGVAPGLAHIGFEVSSLDEVVARLKASGFEPSHLGADHPHRRNIYYIDGEGLEFEFTQYLSDKTEEKNSYV